MTADATDRRAAPSRPRPLGRRADDRVALTDNQQRVLDLVSLGYENKEIAGELGISTQAVKQSVSLLLRKYQVPTRGALMRGALAMRLLGGAEPREVPFEYLFDEAPVLVALTGGPDHRFTVVNRALRRVFGEREYLGRPFAEVLGDAGPALLEALDRAFRSGQTSTVAELRVRMPAAGGARHAWITSVVQPTRGPDGRPDGVAFYAVDVSEQVRARVGPGSDLRALIEHLPVAAAIVDADGRLALMNAQLQLVLGHAPDPSRPLEYQASDFNVRWLDSGELVRPGTGPSSRALAGWPFEGEVLLRRSGVDVVLHVSARPLPDTDGNVVGAILVVREVGPPGQG